MSGRRVLGVDSCKAGWVGIVLSDGDPRACVAAQIGDLVDEADRDGPLEVIAIDIPIGLPDTGRRRADLLARKAAGPRWASVFITPVRAALEAGRQTRRRVVEVHPEVGFAQLAGEPLHLSKSTWAGAARRHQLLAGAGIVLACDLGIAGEKAGIDDVLDAAVAVWTALRVVGDQARPIPDPPETFSDELACAIWA